jgi:prepilin-type N-terminal cleavage/methylation domain-containing protein
MMRYRQRLRINQRGFTVIELMIATMIFGLVLLVVTMGIIQVTRSYYKGVSETNIQTTARSIIDNIGQAIQFGGGTVTTNNMTSPYVFCVGNQQYSFRPGWVVTDGTPNTSVNETPHGLYVRTLASCPGQPIAALANTALAGGRELLGPNMRLTSLRVTQVAGTTNMYNISLRIVSGDNDLIYSPSGGGVTAADATCRNQRAGTQFCSVSDLSTTVTKRVR